MSTYQSVNERREKYWLRNALRYRLMRLFRGRRDQTLWLFSAWEGRKYSDNTQALFEYMLDAHPEIKCIWQTRNEEVYRTVQAKGYPVQMIGTPEAIEAQKKAGVVLYTNGLDDFGDSPYIYGATIIALWHGVGFKKVYRLLTPHQQNHKLHAILSNAKWALFSWVKRDITIAASSYNEQQSRGYFHLPSHAQICIAGQARNDFLSASASIESVITDQSLQERMKGKRIILFMPTFKKDVNQLARMLSHIYTDPSIRDVLNANNAIFVSKMHYLNQINLQSDDAFIFLADTDVKDVQQLMCCADLMVTDYSSCVIDYALLHRPVLYYLPDWEENKHTVMQEAETVCFINCAQSPEELVEKIKAMLENPEAGLRQSEALNQLFAAPNAEIGSFCRQNYEAIMHILSK